MALGWLRNPEHWLEEPDSLREGKYEWFIEAVSLDLPKACPRCCAPAELLDPHGSKKRHLIDVPQLGTNSTRLKRVSILMHLKRYLCARCGKTPLQPLHGVEGDERITTRLKAYAAEEALLKNYKDVARATKLAPRSVRELCAELTARLEATERPGLSDVISVDGVYYARRERIIITAPKKKIVVEVLPGGKAEEILDDLLERFTAEERRKVKVIVIDMSSTLRAVVRSAFPKAKIVIDRFHVFKKANEAVDGVRECLRKRRAKERRAGAPTMVRSEILRKHREDLTEEEAEKLDWWLELLPELKEAYEMKELFATVWYSSSPETAKERYREWLAHLAQCSEVVRRQFAKHLTRAVDDWGADIFAYFDQRFDSAFTERMNQEVKNLNRRCRRLSFKNMRLKMIYGTLIRLRREEEDRQHTLERVARMKKPRKGPWTVTQKPPKRSRQRGRAATRLSLEPKSARRGLVQYSLPFAEPATKPQSEV